MTSVNHSVRVDCDNCGDRGVPTGEREENAAGDQTPILECETCRSRWRTNEARLIGLLIAESTAARGVDLWAVEHQGFYATEWAALTGRNESTVARNVRRAREG
jgi:hypothetical protein